MAESQLRRRDGRVAEGARLESVFRGNSNVGSNPTLSATLVSSLDESFSARSFGKTNFIQLKRPYFSSVMIARCFPFISVSVCVRSRRLNRTVPLVYLFTTSFPSGVVDFKSPSSRNTTTTSLSWKCIGVATPGVHVESHTITRQFSNTFLVPGRGKASG